MSKESRLKRFGRKIAKFLGIIFIIIYVFSTSIIPVSLFAVVLYRKESFIYAIAISVISLIVMDIICSIGEDIIEKVKLLLNELKKKRQIKKEKKKIKKQEEVRKLEKLLNNNNYEEEVEQLLEDCEEFNEKVLLSKRQLSESVIKDVKEICSKIQEILEYLQKDSDKYYEVRHTFRVYYPEFKRMTEKCIDNAEEDNIDSYKVLIDTFNSHLDNIRANMNSIDKSNFNLGIKSLIRIMETERNKGEEE